MFPTSYGLLESILSSEALIDTSNVATLPSSGNVNEWGGITDAGNNWQGAFTLKPTTPIYEVYTLDGWKEITAKEYEILIAISKVSVRVATRRNCIEVTDLIGFF